LYALNIYNNTQSRRNERVKKIGANKNFLENLKINREK
jgi:hypothetical protein